MARQSPPKKSLRTYRADEIRFIKRMRQLTEYQQNEIDKAMTALKIGDNDEYQRILAEVKLAAHDKRKE